MRKIVCDNCGEEIVGVEAMVEYDVAVFMSASLLSQCTYAIHLCHACNDTHTVGVVQRR